MPRHFDKFELLQAMFSGMIPALRASQLDSDRGIEARVAAIENYR